MLKSIIIALFSLVSMFASGLTIKAEEITDANLDVEVQKEEKIILSELFPDSGLAHLIVDELNTLNVPISNVDSEVSTSDLDKITSISVSSYREPIYTLEGIEHLVNLTNLNLRWTRISDITPFVELPNLRSVSISNSEIKDISPLLTYYSFDRGYTSVSLNYNKIKDFSLIEEIVKLKETHGNSVFCKINV